jgi:FG-GAP-like repeat/Bacterial Ig-like domain
VVGFALCSPPGALITHAIFAELDLSAATSMYPSIRRFGRLNMSIASSHGVAVRFLVPFALVVSFEAHAALNVVASSPAKNALGVSTAATVSLTFDQALDPATVTAANIRLTGKFSGPVFGALTLDGTSKVVTFTPARPYFVAETVMVLVSKNLKSATQEALTNGYFAKFEVKGGLGSKTFTLTDTVAFKEPGEAITRLYGFNALDIDGDGSPDMSGTNEISSDVRLRRNNGCGGFSANTIIALPDGSEPSPNDGGDMNGDGRVDLVTGNQGSGTVAVFKNNGAGSYLAPLITNVGGTCPGVTLLDADSDGDLDVLATNHAAVRYLRNDGLGNLTNVAGFDGGGSTEWQVSATDSNLDGRVDAFVANFNSNSVGLLLGDGAGGFTLSNVRTVGANPWALACGDVDADGDGDCVVGNNGGASVSVVRSNGSGGTNATVASYGVSAAPVSVDLADIDGDSDLDLSVSCFAGADCRVFWNTGTAFTPAATLPAVLSGSCSVLVDHDRDGDTDIIVTDELSDEAYVYSQIGPAPTATQPPSCAAALRVNQSALRAGFGTQPALSLPLGSTVFLNVAGNASQPWLLLLGIGASGTPTSAGLFNLSGAFPLVTVVAFGAAGNTNTFGEALLATTVPFTAATGIPATLQAAVGSPGAPLGAVFTNPETIVLTP